MKSVFCIVGILMSGLACANDDAPSTVGLKLNSSGPKLMFDVAQTQGNTNSFVGVKGEIPLTEKDRALQRFKEHLSQRSSVQLYGQLELGYQGRSK